MYNRLFLITLGLLGGLAVFACKPAYKGPQGFCRYDGASGGINVRVLCTGIGTNQESAMIDAKKAATYYVITRTLKTPYQRTKFGTISNGFYARYSKFIAEAKTDGTYKQDDNGMARVQAKVLVRRDQVLAYLKENGVTDQAVVRKQIGNPSVAVVTRWKTRDPRWESFTRGAANTFLTERKYETIDLESKEKLLGKVAKRVAKLDNLPVDKRFRTAMMLGADVYFEVTCWNVQKGNTVKGAARVKAYETSTSRLLGDSTAFGKEYVKSSQVEFMTVKEAIQNAMQPVLTQVNGYWQQDASKGNRFTLLLVGNMNKVEDMGDQIVLTLKRYKEISDVKCPVVSKHRIPCSFRSPKEAVEIRLMLKSVLRKAPGVGSVRYLMKSRKLLIAAINHGGTSTTSNTATPASDSDDLPPGL